jgi:hypothetical protein
MCDHVAKSSQQALKTKNDKKENLSLSVLDDPKPPILTLIDEEPKRWIQDPNKQNMP